MAAPVTGSRSLCSFTRPEQLFQCEFKCCVNLATRWARLTRSHSCHVSWNSYRFHRKLTSAEGPAATRDMAPPSTGSAPPPPPPVAGKIPTSFTSSSGRYRAHLPAHILTDIETQIPLFWGFSSKSLPRLRTFSWGLANLAASPRPCPYPQCRLPTAHPQGQTGSRALPRPHPQEHLLAFSF